MSEKYYEYSSVFTRVGRSPAVLRQPIEKSDRSDIGILLMHSDQDYLDFTPGTELAKRGYTTLAANPYGGTLENKLRGAGDGVKLLRSLPGINKVIILGHSGGATLMSAYQSVAENGVKVFQGDEMFYKLPDIGEQPAADGVMLLDSNWGNGTMTLLSLDPAVVDETNGYCIDPELDLFNPANGFDPEGSTYSDEFIAKFQKAQGERMNRLIMKAVKRLEAVQAGRGLFADDEPFLVPAGNQMVPNNRLFPQDIRLLSHTKNEHLLLHKDGVQSTEIVRSLRLPRGGHPVTDRYNMAITTSLKVFLSNSILWTNGFHYDDTSLYGADFSRSWCCTPGNMTHVSAPLLVMGMTGGYESMAAEMIWEAAPSTDKTLAYVEGATHNFYPNKEAEKFPGQFGDTIKTMCDYIDTWLFTERFGK